MPRLRFTPLCAAGALACLFAAGCGKEQAPAAQPSTAPAATAPAAQPLTAAELDAVSPPARRYKLALIVKTRNNPFFDPMIRAAEEQARALGVDLDVQAPAQESDKEQQFAMVQNVAARKVDAILVAPADSRGIVPALKQARDHGILVVNIDNRVDGPTASAAGLDLAGYVGADNEEGGRLAGQEMVTALGGQGKVALLEGIRGADNAEARKRGFEQAVEGKLDVVARDTAEWDTAKAYAKFQSMLAANPGIEGLFCANDKMALGAMKAIQEAGKAGKVVVIGFDNIPDVRTALKAGQMRATIEQHPDLMGKYGVLLAVGVLESRVPAGREFLVPLDVVTK